MLLAVDQAVPARTLVDFGKREENLGRIGNPSHTGNVGRLIPEVLATNTSWPVLAAPRDQLVTDPDADLARPEANCRRPLKVDEPLDVGRFAA
jgi:hypothetical protein